MSFLSSLMNALPGAAAQGLAWGIMAIGVYITFRILDVADMTVDGSLATGGAVCVMLIRGGFNPWIALLQRQILMLQLLYRSSHFIRLRRQLRGNIINITFLLNGICQCSETAEHLNAHATFVLLHPRQSNHADLAGKMNMGCTAGTDIIARDLHNTNRSVYLLLAAVRNLHQFLP